MNILIYSVVAVLVLIAIVTLANAYDDALLTSSLTEIPPIQQGSSKATQIFYNGFSNYFLKLVILLTVFVPYYFITQRARSFYYVLLLSTTIVITYYTKLLYVQPRPFWVSAEVQAYDCWGDYGNPGQNILFATAITLTAFFDYNAYQQAKPEEERTNWVIRSLYLLLIGVFCSLVGYATFFTGANSSNQILLGAQLGLWLAVVFHTMIRDSLLDLVQSVIFGLDQMKNNLMFWPSTIFTLALIVQITNYEQSGQNNLPIEWVQNITAKCGPNMLKDAFQMRSLADFGMSSFALGSFIGIILQYIHYPRLISSGPRNDTATKALCRFIIAWLLTAPWAALVLIFQVQTKQNPYVLFIFGTTFPIFLIGFSFFYLADLVNIKLGLLETSETMADAEDPEKKGEKECNSSEDEKSSLLLDSDREQQSV